MSRSILIALFTLLVTREVEAQALPAQTAGWREALAAAVRRATAQNPRIQEAESRAEAAGHRVPQSSVLPDPELELGLKDVPVTHPSLTRDNFTMEMLTVRQRLPARGMRSAERAAAQADAEGAAALKDRAEVEVAAQVGDAFFRLAEIDQSLALLEDARRRLEDASASATARYKVGRASQSDVLQASLERTSLDEQLSTLRAERRTQAARLNALQGLPAGDPVPRIDPVTPDFAIPAPAELVQRASERSPDVVAAMAVIHRAEEELKLARLERRPSWALMGYYGRRERFEDLAGASASITLPWLHGGRLNERQAEKEASLAAARAGLDAVRNELQEEIELAYADFQKNVEQGRLYRDSILPQAEINYRAAQESYTVGKIDLLTLVRAANSLSFYEREAAARASGAGRAVAALQRASGLPLIPGTPETGGSHGQH